MTDTQPISGEGAISYKPEIGDGNADPGEVVWGWVPYEDDENQGKDRPVLVIGEKAGVLLALMLSSKDHDRDEAQEATHGRRWMDVGTGGWDSQGRPSEVRLDRLVRMAPGDVRREGDALAKEIFDDVINAARDHLV